MLGDLQPYLVGMLKNETEYGEPFVGGGSVALHVARHFPKIKLRLNDKDPLIAGLWRVICGPSAGVNQLIKLIDVVPTLSLWRSTRSSEPKTDLNRAFKAIFMNRTSWNGIVHDSRPIGGLEQKSKWPIGCRYNVGALSALLVAYHELLSGRTVVTELDAVEFVRRFSCPCFIDPPYLMDGKNKLYGVSMTESEHRNFAKALRTLRKWVLTYDNKDRVACDLYWRVDKKLIDTRYSMDTAHRAHREVVGVAEWKKASEICAHKGFSLVLNGSAEL